MVFPPAIQDKDRFPWSLKNKDIFLNQGHF